MLHDVGKIGVPDAILLKTGPLDEEEHAIIKRHPEMGSSLLADGDSPVLRLGAQIALKVSFNKTLGESTPVTIEPVNPETKPPQPKWDLSSDAAALGTWIAGEHLGVELRRGGARNVHLDLRVPLRHQSQNAG